MFSVALEAKIAAFVAIEFGFLAFRYPFAYAEGCIAGRRAASGHLSLVTANETGLDLRLGKVGDSTVQATSAKISAASCDRESLIHLIRKERFVMRVVEPGTVSNLLGRFLTFAVVVSMQVGAQNVPLRQGLLEQLNSSLKELAERVSPAVVEVKVLGYGVDDDREDNDGDNGRSLVKQRLSGAGVILDSNGYIVTNAHLVEGAKRVQVILNPTRAAEMPIRTYLEAPGRTYDAIVVGVHQETDLAVLKIRASSLPTLQFANYENLQQGQMVVAFGSPLGLRNAATETASFSVLPDRRVRPEPRTATY